MRLEVVEYDDEWPNAFERERLLLVPVLAPWLDGGVHHIGSTSIPGLAAKPILDMMAGVRDLVHARGAVERLAALRYVHAPHRADALWFHKTRPDDPDVATHALHLTVPGSALWRERLAFRDALRREPSLAAEYEALKRRLAGQHRDDLRTYTDGKRAFVAQALAAAGVDLDETAPRLRAATPADAPAIAVFQTTCWREAYRGLVPPDYLERVGPAEREIRWRERLEPGGRHVVLAESGGVPIGVVSAGESTEPDVPALELKSLYVAAPHRGSGVADALLGAAIGLDSAYLWMFEDNPRAMAFYARHGFRADGVRQLDPDTAVPEIRLVR